MPSLKEILYMNDNTTQQYTSDDVNRIIRRALRIEESELISHKELLETARELGIDPTRIETAIETGTGAQPVPFA
jgi:hypothetical protein